MKTIYVLWQPVCVNNDTVKKLFCEGDQGA